MEGEEILNIRAYRRNPRILALRKLLTMIL